MRGSALLVLTLLAGAAFTGCISSDDPPADAGLTPQDAGSNGVLDANETTSAPDGRGDISAFKETNKTETGTGGIMHAHDYWSGETRKVIWTQDIGLIPFPLIPEGKAPGTAIADFDIPAPEEGGGLVYEGSSSLELVIKDVIVASTVGSPVDENQPAHPHVTIMFDYLTAADEPGAFRTGGTLQPDTPFIIPVGPTEADMPHQTKSLWLFRIYTGEANAFQFNLTLTAVKGNAVVNWPPHPDLYADKPVRTIYDGDVSLSNKGTVDYLVFANLPDWHHPERVISYGTDKLEITISNVAYSGQVTPERYLLETHNASYLPKLGNSDQAGGRYEDPTTDGATFKFTVPVDERGFDTPYGQKSRWGFHFVPRFADATDCFAAVNDASPGLYQFWQQFVVGCQYPPYDMTYHMTILAYGHSTAMGVEDLAAPTGGPVP
jgi:hypothetical protein